MFMTIYGQKKFLLLILSIVLTFILGYYIFKLPSIPSSTDNMEFRVVVDPGHGSIDTGTHYNNVYEKNINLSIAKYLEQELKKVNIIAIMTRKEDKLYNNDRNEDLKHRPEIAQKYNADLYISLHVNNFSTSYPRGSQIFFKPGSGKSKKLAESIQNKLIKLRVENKREILSGNFYVLNKVSCPAVLIESGFLSNPDDRSKLTDMNYQKKFARAVKDGTVSYLQQQLNNNIYSEKNNSSPCSCSYDSMKVYYLNSNNSHFCLQKHDFIYPIGSFLTGNFHDLNNKEIIALTLLEQLINPPDNYISTLPAKTKIKNIELKENTLLVNFSNHIKSEFTGGASLELMAINSIKKTLFSIPGINEIIILINGEKGQSIGGHIILGNIKK